MMSASSVANNKNKTSATKINNNNDNNNNNNNSGKINEQELEIEGVLIAQGAEARVYKSHYEEKTTIVKYRFPKKYRHPLLDLKLRRNRSKKEQKCIGKAKEAGIRVPEIYYYDRDNCAIHMQFFELPTVKSVIVKYYDADSKTYEKNKCLPILKAIGKNIGILHRNHLVHGDLTTSNLLIDENAKQQQRDESTEETKQKQKEEEEEEEDEDDDLVLHEIVMIDFGLSEGSSKAEDKAVDLYVLERAFVSTHPESEFMVDVILDEYKRHYADGHKQVLKRLEAVRLRGRKRSMIG